MPDAKDPAAGANAPSAASTSREAQSYSFEIARGFRRDPAAHPAPVDAAFAELPPLLRTLLVTDGTVTRTLEVHRWEPISVEKLFHAEVPSDVDVPALGIAVGDDIIKRRVTLRGRISGTVYVAAETFVATRRFSPHFREILRDGELGIGELIRDHRLETFREIVEVTRIEAGRWAADLSLREDEPAWLRRYHIHHQGMASVEIIEVFAEARFLEG